MNNENPDSSIHKSAREPPPPPPPVPTAAAAESPRGRKKHPVLRALMFTAGCLLILAGAALGFLPFLPGFPLGILGVGLLAASSSRVRALLRKLTGYLPRAWRQRARTLLRRRA